MSAINKKNTKEFKHYQARTVKNIQIIDENGIDTPIIAFVGSGSATAGAAEIVMPMTQQAWSRAALGAGTTTPALRDGLNMSSRYRFVILTDNVEGEDNTKRETVVGVHCIPDDNYIRCDFGATLGRPNITSDSAVIQIHEHTGEIDVVAYPEAIRRNVDAFVKALEEIEEFDNTTAFTVGDINYTITNAFGTELTFRCTKRR